MVLNLIGLVVLLCALANANESNNCTWAQGVGTCTSLNACEYSKNGIPFNKLYSCNCCPTNTPEQRQKLEAPPLVIAQRTSTNRLNPTERISNPIAIEDVCNATSKTGNCDEKSYCMSNLGNGICKQGEHCEPYANYRRPQWSFAHCNYNTICCVTTRTELIDIDMRINTSQLATTTQRTTSTTSTIASITDSSNNIQTIGNNPAVTSSNQCQSRYGPGICKYYSDCEPFRNRKVLFKDLTRCGSSRLNYCCPLGIAAISDVIPSATIRNDVSTDNRKLIEGSSCQTKTGSGICKQTRDCEPLLTGKVKYSELLNCKYKTHYAVLCCPDTVDNPM